jgi:hypothetical protein
MKRALWVGCAVFVACAFAGSTVKAAKQEVVDKAVERGVAFLHKGQPATQGFTSSANPVGPSALVGLALLECGAGADDEVVRRAAETVRSASPTLNDTYSLALAVLFLDRLGDSTDAPLIESMTVRLMAGQNSDGGWSYTCPDQGAAEVARLTTYLKQQRELIGRRERPKEGIDDKTPDAKRLKRSVEDLPKEIRDQIALISAAPKPAAGAYQTSSDNSNTQFATLALWVGRRQGLPVETALARLGRRFHETQNSDGGWSYNAGFGAGMSSATMTCAGLLGLAVAHGSTAEVALEKGKKPPDPAKDRAVRAGLTLLGTAVGRPFDRRQAGPPPLTILAAPGRTYYFLWSLERVSVALDLKTVGGKDWYGWGSEILLVNQSEDGSWQGENGATVDTCFALLFLKRANLASDLTARLKGQLQDPGEVTLKAGGGADDLDKAPAGFAQGLGSMADSVRLGDPEKVSGEYRSSSPDSKSALMARELFQAPAERRDQLLEQYRDGKGVNFTEALSAAIPQLTGDAKSKARDALAERLTRMKADTLVRYFRDPDAEIRRAAALAVAMKEDKALIPDLIPMLEDPERSVVQAAHASLKDLSGEKFGPSADEWKAWWKKRDGK